MGRDLTELRGLVAQCYWWHAIDLGGEVVTPGHKPLDVMQREYANTFQGIDLAGKRVLDVGAWNGGFTAEAVRRGAAHVTAVDHVTWNNPEANGRLSFDLVVQALGIPATAVDIDMDAPGLSLAGLGQFDVVLFLGVFYHLQDPIAALREVARATKEVLVVETYVDRTLDPRPLMMFYPGDELVGDASNWWGPSEACVVALLRMLGFTRVSVFAGSYPERAVFHARW